MSRSCLDCARCVIWDGSEGTTKVECIRDVWPAVHTKEALRIVSDIASLCEDYRSHLGRVNYVRQFAEQKP